MSGLAARVARRGERGRTSDGSLDRRLAALAEAAELARGRLDGGAVAAAEAVVGRAGQRLGLGVETTVIALAGPTGAGKSTLFNALAGTELSTPGHRRPTTSTASAAVWGAVNDALLDWLEVPRRHRMGDELDGLVLLDLPDFDSVVREHRLEVDRVVALADLMVWVVDPQKYADASLHEHYLRPHAGHREAMLVVLNQADRLEPADRDSCLADLGALLERDGLPGVPVLAVSARTHEGLGALRAVLAERVALREAAATRLAADVTAAAARLDAGCGGKREGSIGRADRAALVDALEQAAGVPGVVRAVDRAHRRRGALAAGWPYGRWLLRLRPDPLRRLRLPDRVDPDSAPGDRASLPPATPVQRAQVGAGARAVAARAGEGLPEPWPGLLRAAALREEARMPDRLEAAVAGTDLGLRRPAWWRAAGVLQLAAAAVALVGALWLAALAVLGYLQLGDIVPTPDVEGFALPTLLLLGGIAAGLLLALLARIVNGAGARRRARAAGRALRARVEAVADEHVLAPVEAELDSRARLCAAVAAAGRA